MNKKIYLSVEQKVWLHHILYGDNQRIKDWYFGLPIGVSATNILNDVILDGYYTDISKDLLNYMRREYINEFGIGSTSSPI